jgi:SOS response regulatory protein OraA/RecX
MDLKRLGIEENHLERLRSEFYPFSEEVKDGVALLRKWFQFGESQKIKLIQRLVRRGFHSDAAEESWSQFQETMEEEQP